MEPILLLVTGLPGVGKSSFASSVASTLAAPVIGHDWVMAGLRTQPEVWASMRQLDWVGFRTVGWSVMWNLAQAQLREGRSVILDGVARDPEIEQTRHRASQEGAKAIVVVCELENTDAHKDRISSRSRKITGWPELEWKDIERARQNWSRPSDFDLLVDCARTVEENRSAFLEAFVVS